MMKLATKKALEKAQESRNLSKKRISKMIEMKPVPIQEEQITAEVVRFPYIQKLTEIYQTVDLRFSFLVKIGENKYQEQHPACKCRDYLHDIVNSTLEQSVFEIYGMSYSGKQYPIDLTVTRLYLQFPSILQKKLFEDNLEYLHKIETDSQLPKSRLIPVDKTSLIIEADPFWMTNTVLVSLFSFLCRLMCYKNCLPDEGKDASYLKGLRQNPKYQEALKDVRKLKTEHFHGLDKQVFDKLHDYSGILTYFQFPKYLQFYDSEEICSANLIELRNRGVC